MPHIQAQQLLTEVSFKVATLHDAKKRVSSQLAPDFQIFGFLRNDEMGISACLANLLDPQGNHGQGAIFLNLFLHQVVGTPTRFMAPEDCTVSTEKQANGQRRLDIHLAFQNGVIGIENKPWALDQKDQLEDYANYLRGHAGERQWLLLYFSNQPPSMGSIGPQRLASLQSTDNYIQVSFSQITDWLDACAGKAKALTVRVFIEQLVKFINAEINGIVDMSESKEIESSLLSDSKNLQAAFHVANALEQVKGDLLSEFINDFKSKVQAEGWIPVCNDKLINTTASAYTGFGIKFAADDDKLLYFEFNKPKLNGFFWGIRRSTGNVNKDTQVWQVLNDAMARKFGEGKQSTWWPWYSDYPNQVLDRQHRTERGMIHWQISGKPWLMIQSGGLVSNIISLGREVQNLLQGASIGLSPDKALSYSHLA